MKSLYFDEYEDLAIAVSERYEDIKSNDDLDSIDIIGKYDAIKEIMAELISFGYEIAFITEFADPEWDNYEDEYILSLSDNKVWCEPAKRNTGYIHPEAKFVYLLEDCNSKIIPFIEADEIYEVEITDNCGDCEKCNNCKISLPINYFSVNGKEVSKDEYENKMLEIDKRFQSHMKTVLEDYEDFIDEMNNWKSLLGW